MLSGRRVSAQFKDYDLFDQLNREAFPPEEFLETEKCIRDVRLLWTWKK